MEVGLHADARTSCSYSWTNVDVVQRNHIVARTHLSAAAAAVPATIYAAANSV